jgi:hypothetical protein
MVNNKVFSRRFEATCRLQGLRGLRRMTHEPLKVNTVLCFESSVVINPITQRKNPEGLNPL